MSAIVTFYSYKGGVGRSMCLVNVGVTLGAWGYKVLLVDFDLEAPGLEFFFRKHIGNFGEIGGKAGIINYLNVTANGLKSNWRDLILQIPIPSLGTGMGSEPGYGRNVIDVLTSGNRNDQYVEGLRAFQADEFYKHRKGGRIIEDLREEWKVEYDFVLIDSRTGLTDIGGICTIQLPDILVTLFTATEQGWLGAKDTSSRANSNQRKLPFERDRLKILPIPTRIDYSEKILTDEWLDRFSRDVVPIVSNWIDAGVNTREFVDRIFIPYVPFYSFGESIAVLDNVSSPSGIGYALVGISALLAQELRGNGLLVTNRDEYVAKSELAGRKLRLEKHGAVESPLTTEGFSEAKLIMLGEGGVGKTSLMRRLFSPSRTLPGEEEFTHGLRIQRFEYLAADGRPFRLDVWDFGGQEIYHGVHVFFLSRRALYVLVDDTRRDAGDEGLRYWLDLVDLYGGHSPVLIFQNEKGGRRKAIDLHRLKERYDNVKGLYTGNLEHAEAADSLREAIKFSASNLGQVGEQLPAGWMKVREEIEKRAQELPYITQQEYFEICHRHMAFDRPKALQLSRYLHDLGVFLHFQDDPLLARIVILQFQWATEAVFRILDDQAVKTQLGRFDSADCERIWRDSVYADMHPELLALMQRFELCYLLADSKPQTWLAPQLLPPAKPIKLADWVRPEDLVLRYRYDFMPKGVIIRLMVRLHRFVRNPEMAWITGIMFERDSTTVLVEVLTSGREIELRGRGSERKALLSVVAADLDALNAFQGLRDRVDKLIPCNCKRCREVAVPEFFAQKYLLKRREDNRLMVECPSSYEEVDVIELLDGIRVDKQPGWALEQKPTTSHRTIRIFIASSAELRDDRDAFDLYLRQQNDQYLKKGIYIEVIRWENFLDAMYETRLEDEYNKQVRGCDIFVSLFFIKTGKFTEEEFDTAHRQFKETGRPRIYTFFKDADVPMGNITDEIVSLLQFKKKLGDLGHFYTSYDNIEHLKRQFRDQLDKLIAGDY